jgi:hypothetical protein
MIINADPLVALWAPNNGHTRLSDSVFDTHSKDFTTHITANVANESPEALDFLKEHRFNLREIANYFKDKIGDPDEWLRDIAYPKIKSMLIHMYRASQQSFLIKRSGFVEFYGTDFIMDDTYENFYILESNRRPDVQEKNPELQYREDQLLDDVAFVSRYFIDNGATRIDTDKIYPHLTAFMPLIDETQLDPYFGILEEECRVPFKQNNPKMPVDPMVEPLMNYLSHISG